METPNEEDEFVGEISEKEPKKEEGLTVEQRMRWFEAIDAMKDGVKAIDPLLELELDDDAILNMSRWPIEPIHRIPAVIISHPEFGFIGNMSTSSKDIDVEKFRGFMDKLLEQLRRRYEKAKKRAK